MADKDDTIKRLRQAAMSENEKFVDDLPDTELRSTLLRVMELYDELEKELLIEKQSHYDWDNEPGPFTHWRDHDSYY